MIQLNRDNLFLPLYYPSHHVYEPFHMVFHTESSIVVLRRDSLETRLFSRGWLLDLRSLNGAGSPDFCCRGLWTEAVSSCSMPWCHTHPISPGGGGFPCGCPDHSGWHGLPPILMYTWVSLAHNQMRKMTLFMYLLFIDVQLIYIMLVLGAQHSSSIFL